MVKVNIPKKSLSFPETFGMSNRFKLQIIEFELRLNETSNSARLLVAFGSVSIDFVLLQAWLCFGNFFPA